MIQLRNIKKSFSTEHVLKNFSYDFKDHKFYLIYGPSGSGKTTLANIIATIIPSDEGQIFYNGNELKGATKKLFERDFIYIAQDSYFIEYLDIQKNLEVSGANLDKAKELLAYFSLEYVLDKYPDELSGGEKQRISIIQALARNKKILILDEPTASLDEGNKIKVFTFLHELKNRAMIICISHDEVAKNYCDEVIAFHNLDIYTVTEPIEKSTNVEFEPELKCNLYPFVKLQKKYKKTEKKSIRILTVIIFMLVLMLFACVNPKEKIINSLGKDYHLNYLVIDIPNEEAKNADDLKKDNSGITSMVYDYHFAGDYHEQTSESEVDIVDEFDYVKGLTFATLPSNNSFYYHDFLYTGQYFQKEFDIILGYTYAQKMDANIESLIGIDIPIKTSNGEEKFRIVGVFNPFTKEEEQYFKGNYINDINDNVYLNEEFTQAYLQDDKLSNSEKNPPNKHQFIVYFDNFENLMKFYDKYSENDFSDESKVYVYPMDTFLGSIIKDFTNASIYIYPILLLTSILVVAFYIQMQTIKLQHSLSIFGVYQYYGYNWKTIKSAYRKFYLLEVIKSILIAAIGATACIIPFNYVVHILNLYPYELFSFSGSFLGVLILYLLSVSFLCVCIKLNTLKKFNWFDIIKSRRDLL